MWNSSIDTTINDKYFDTLALNKSNGERKKKREITCEYERKHKRKLFDPFNGENSLPKVFTMFLNPKNLTTKTLNPKVPSSVVPSFSLFKLPFKICKETLI